MCSGPRVEDNVRQVEALARRSAAEGADWLVLPENALWMGESRARGDQALTRSHAAVEALRQLSSDLALPMLVGGVPEGSTDDLRPWNSVLWLDGQGGASFPYRKIHLFDVTVAADTRYRESESTLAGETGSAALSAAVVDVAGWRVGLSICYDLRFPEWYRSLVHAGAEVLAVPAAFTWRTGAAHWSVLLRARAVENQCWVVAPGQCGVHPGTGRETWGHSLVVDPWGTVVAEAGHEPTLMVVDLGRDLLDDVRRRLPSLSHRRLGFDVED
jgi:predicted amidohydrolase